MADWRLRGRAVLDRRFMLVVTIFLVLALVGGWATYGTHAVPGTTTEERPESSWETSGWFNHSVTVTENNSVYPVGTKLTDRPVYFTAIAPTFNGTYAYRYDATESGDLNGTVSLQLVVRSVEENSGGETVIWQVSEPLGAASNESLEPGDELLVPFSVDMNETLNSMDEIEGELDSTTGRPELLIRSTVDIEGTVNGRDVDRVSESAMPVEVERGTYRLADPGVTTESHESTRTVTVRRSYGPLRSIGSPLLLLVSTIALVGLVTARRRGKLALSKSERELLAYTDDRADYDEWITQMELPEEYLTHPRATASSLESLVNYAIDSDEGVVEDPDRGLFAVVTDERSHVYEPPTSAGDQVDADEDSDEPPSRETDAEPGRNESESQDSERP